MLIRLRKRKKAISLFLIWVMTQGIFLESALALTSGPETPETAGFAPAGLDNLVDPFTGDFSYNIDLLNVGGFPINMTYNSGVTPDSEASWVGLGWDLNVGSVSRSKRGLPDDFAGDKVTKEYNTKPNQTFGVTGNISFEAWGAEFAKVGLNANLSYNNYNGFGMSVGASPSISAAMGSKSGFEGSLGINATLGSESGLEVSPKVGISYKQGKDQTETSLNSSLSFPMSTREGLKGTTLSGGITVMETNKSLKARGGAKGDNAGGGVSSSAFQGFAAPTFTPSMENSTYNVNASLNVSFSSTDPATDGFPFGFGRYYSGQFLLDPVKTTPAYGYMYSGVSKDGNKLMDFNREKDAAYNKHTKNLAVTNFTHDIFQVSGQGPGSQGVSGAYRLHRADIGAVHDASAVGRGYNPSLGGDIGFGTPPSTKVGIDLAYNQTNTESGKWPYSRQGIASFQNARQYELKNPGKELVYFKRVGEMTLDNDVSFSSTVKGGQYPMNNGLKSSTSYFGDGELNGQFKITGDPKTNSIPVSAGTKSRRDYRNGSMMYLTAGELAGNDDKEIRPIENYPLNTFTWRQEKNDFRASAIKDQKVGYQPVESISRIGGNRKAHHLSEFRITGSTGARYIYGIPTYNHTQEEVTFAKDLPEDATQKASAISKAYGKGLVDYTPGVDDSKNNKEGLDHMFNRVTTPAFANSFLLTSILSSDYVDRDNVKGPSDGDLGTYTKFNYTKAIDKYKWRTPYSYDGNEASYTEGLLGSDDDDKANYVYGEKEIWYLHSVETRTHVAEFYLSDREDGRGVADKHGRIGGKKQKKLDKIVLYSKPDKFNSNPEVIKTVHFEYDYSLSPNTPNSTASTGGKLTLKKVWFTYGDSNKGILNPYEFNYGRQKFTGVVATDKEPEARFNPPYSHKNYDRWGVYMPDEGDELNKGKLNAEFPYTDPDRQNSDVYAAAYALTAIKSPTGGTTRVFYEADDYGYVQNRQAMRMFKVKGMTKTNVATEVPSNKLFDHTLGLVPDFSKLEEYKYIVIDLKEGFEPKTSDPDQEFRDKYLKGIDVMYYKYLIGVLNKTALAHPGGGFRDEFVRGYAEIDIANSKLGTETGGKYETAFVAIKPTKIKSYGAEKSVLPMIKSSWLFVHTTLSRELMGSANADDSGLEQTLRALLSMTKTIFELFNSFAKTMKDNGHGSQFVPERSFIRLNEPDKIKIGGGHRVKAVVMVDNWDIMTSDTEQSSTVTTKELAAYGQYYDYTMLENGEVISSGVAAYEPVPGGDENPFRMPIFSKEKIPLAPDKESFVEEPFGEFAFPSPKVGYRKVTVTPLKITNANNPLNSIYESADDDSDGKSNELVSDHPKGNGTGKVVNEFYTAFDFPTKVKQTKLDVKRHKPNLIFKFMKFDNKDLVTCSQGYSVELNDMHGKQKRKSVYSEIDPTVVNPQPISEVENLYKFTADGEVSNRVNIINPDLSISRETPNSAELGVEVDVVQDERFYESTTIGGGLQFNLKWVQAAVVPIVIPTFFPDFSYDKTRFRSVVTTKIVNKHAIASGTIAKDNGAAIETHNLAWDAQTGEVLLTKTQNEFHDEIYSFNYPGHWAYERLKHASENEGLVFKKDDFGKALQFLKDGDELIISGNPDNTGHCFYDAVTGSLIDDDGAPITDYSVAKVVRSGGRNMATTPIGSTTTLENPMKPGNTYLSFNKVLNTSANEYKEIWHEFCNCEKFGGEPHATTNPFLLGQRGSIRPWRNWTYLTNRSQTQWNDNLSVRNDGIFEDYTPFWGYSGTDKLLKAPSSSVLPTLKWQFISQIEKYNAVGLALEQQDALNRFTMAQYGYGKNLQIAGASNAEYREAGYDGFEDYDFADCEDDHFNFRKDYSTNVTNKEAHTGRNSIKVQPGETLQMHKIIIPCDNNSVPSNDPRKVKVD